MTGKGNWRDSGVSRRDVMRHTLSSGFALAVTPIAGTVLATDATGLIAGDVKIPTAAGEIPAYRASPKKKAPVLLVVHEIFGVHEHIKDVCRRLAKRGHMAIAPEMYARQGDVSKLEMSKVMEVVARVPDAQVMSDLDAAVEYARKTGKADTKRLGITGFCWGGRVVWLYAAHNPRLKAGVAWYGRLVARPGAPPSELQPTHPVDVAASLKVPVLGLYGEKDQGIPLESIELMRKELAKSKSASEIVVYPDAPHGFHADYRPSYRKGPAEDGWARLLAWFKKHGAA